MILYLGKKYMWMHVHTHTNEHTLNIQRICNTYPEQSDLQ